MNQMMVECPYCREELPTGMFLFHCNQRHPDVDLPEKLTLDQLVNRYAPLGGITIKSKESDGDD